MTDIFDIYDAEDCGMDTGVCIYKNNYIYGHWFCSAEDAEEKILDEYPDAKVIIH